MAGLQLEQAPPLGVPLRFFLTAPAFALLAAAGLAWLGPASLGSRWSPGALALTHLLTLGFMAMVMLGAMMQVFPVLAGAPFAKPRLVAGVTHWGLVLGTLVLCAGLFRSEALLLESASGLLLIAFVVFAGSAVVALAKARLRGALPSELGFAVIAMALAVLPGLQLAAGRARGAAIAVESVRELHPGWALAGWAGLLVAAVGKQVVPMFQMTPSYPRTPARYFCATVFALLVLWTLALALQPVLALAAGLVLAAAYLAFSITTLALQRRRRRRAADATLNFWRLGMACLALTALLWSARMLDLVSERFDVTLGVLAIVGAGMSLINGMLYKILPFLAWFHLQALGAGRRGLSMKSFLAEAPQVRQFGMHLAALLLLLGAASGASVLVYPAAACFAASALMLAANMATVLRGFAAERGRQQTAGTRSACPIVKASGFTAED